ncbi:MAG TPA: DUF222 domain-containing protein [Chloroflexota bacterium]|nr:DUF222 domain-containing protein [Chloroflexota bacterium]
MTQPQDFGSPGGTEQVAALVEKVTRHRQLYAEILGDIAELERDKVARELGCPSTQALLVDALHVSRRTANHMVRQAQQVTETVTPTGHVTPAPLPTLREAVREGQVDGEHIDAVTAVLSKLPTTTSVEHRELVEATLAITARTSSPRVVAEHGDILLQRLDPDGAPPTDAEAKELRNELFLSRTPDGGVKLRGYLQADTAETLYALLGSLAKPDSAINGVPDQRTEPHRNGDGLADIVHGAANLGVAPAQGGEKPHLSIQLDINDLLDGTGLATADGGAVFCPQAVRRIACDAGLVPIVLNEESLPLDVGRAKRLVNPSQRRALVARDKGCAFPGCHLSARWADAHHIQHWIDGGPTDLHNLVLLCRRHHRLLHDKRSGWSIHMINGLPHFRPPTWMDPQQKLLRNRLRQ